jgi:hypothetical protein
MSVYVCTRLKDGVEPAFANHVLAGFFNRGTHEDFQKVRFITEQDNREWLDDINNNPSSPQAHLKPKQGKLSMQDLKTMFPLWTEPGLSDIDIGFSRTSTETMQCFLAFVSENRHLIKESSGIRELIERCGAPNTYETLSYLDTEFNNVCYELPKSRQEPLELSGITTIKGMNDQDYAVMFGNVARCQFKKRRTHIHPNMDGIHVNHLAQPVLLVPLIRLGEGGLSDLEDAWRTALELGVREDFRVFAARIYGETFLTRNPSEMKEKDALRLIDAALERVGRFMSIAALESLRFLGLNRGKSPDRAVRLHTNPLDGLNAEKARNWVYYAAIVLRKQHGWSNDQINDYIVRHSEEYRAVDTYPSPAAC